MPRSGSNEAIIHFHDPCRGATLASALLSVEGVPLLPRVSHAKLQAPIKTPGLVLAACKDSLAPCGSVPLGDSIRVWNAMRLCPLNELVPALFGVKHGHMKVRISILDFQRSLLSVLERVMPRFQLAVDRNMERLSGRRLARFSDGSWHVIGDQHSYVVRALRRLHPRWCLIPQGEARFLRACRLP